MGGIFQGVKKQGVPPFDRECHHPLDSEQTVEDVTALVRKLIGYLHINEPPQTVDSHDAYDWSEQQQRLTDVLKQTTTAAATCSSNAADE